MLELPSYPAITGIGIDIVEIDRLRAILTRDSAQFIKNTFTVAELKYCQKHADAAPHFAGMFAAKEAVRKATGNLEKSFSEIEIRHTSKGKPEVWIGSKQITSLHISISHSNHDAIAVAIKTQ